MSDIPVCILFIWVPLSPLMTIEMCFTPQSHRKARISTFHNNLALELHEQRMAGR